MAENLVKSTQSQPVRNEAAKDARKKTVAAEAADTYRALADSVKRAGQNELDRALLKA